MLCRNEQVQEQVVRGSVITSLIFEIRRYSRLPRSLRSVGLLSVAWRHPRDIRYHNDLYEHIPLQRVYTTF